MDHRAAPDDDLAHRLRAGIDVGDLPAPDLADVQRRADRRARRRTVRTTAVAGASALVLVGVLAVAVPAISGVVAARDGTSTALADRHQGPAGPSGDLTDPSVWPTLPPVRGSDDPYLSPGAVEAAVGPGAWTGPIVAMVGPWNIPECGPDLRSETSERDAALDLRPSSTHVEPWATPRLGADGAPAPLDPAADPFDAFAAVSALRWGGAPNDGGRSATAARTGTDDVTGGVRAAGAWWHAALRAEAACPGAEVVHGTVPGGDAAPAGQPVVVATPYPPGTVGADEGRWGATAIAAGGPTAVVVDYSGASSAQEAGDAALAILRAAVRAVTTTDRDVVTVDRGNRSGGVDDARLTDFTDPDGWAVLPRLRTIGAPPEVSPVTADDPAAAFPGTRSWESGPIAGTGTDWVRSWCAPDAFLDAKIPDRPGDHVGGGAPADEAFSIWEGRSGLLGRPRVDVDVLRWGDRDAVGATGVDQVALDAANAWGVAIADDATACPDVVTLDPTGLPGERATLTAVDDGGRWRVQAIAVGGPTAVRVRATIEADDADAAGGRAVAMARRVIANTVRADAVEQGRTDPGPLP